MSSVTYGRVFYLLIQSTESVQAMEGSIDASFKGAVAGGSIGVDANYVGELKSVRIGGYAIGGEANRAAAALTGDFEALKRFTAEGGPITTGKQRDDNSRDAVVPFGGPSGVAGLHNPGNPERILDRGF